MSVHMIPVSAAVVKENGRFLLTQRLPNKNHANEWEFPGGKLEAGETPEEALSRELTEELDMETEIGAVLDVRVSGEYLLLFYEVRRKNAVLNLKEAQDARFVTPEEARQLPMAPQDAETMERLIQLSRLQ